MAKANVASASHCDLNEGMVASDLAPFPATDPWHDGHDGHVSAGCGAFLSVPSLSGGADDSSSDSWQQESTICAASTMPEQCPPTNDAAWQQHSGMMMPMSRATKMRSRG